MAEVPPNDATIKTTQEKPQEMEDETTEVKVQEEEENISLIQTLQNVLGSDDVNSSVLNRSTEDYESSSHENVSTDDLEASLKAFKEPKVVDSTPIESLLPDSLYDSNDNQSSSSLVTHNQSPSSDPTTNSSASNQNLSNVPLNRSEENVGLGGSLPPYQNPNRGLVPYASNQNNFNPNSGILHQSSAMRFTPQPSYAVDPNFAARFGPPLPYPYDYNIPERYQNAYEQHPMGMPYPYYIPGNTYNNYYMPQNTYEQHPMGNMGMPYHHMVPGPPPYPLIPQNTYDYNMTITFQQHHMMRMGMQPHTGPLMLTQRPHWSNADPSSSNSSQD